MRTIRSITIAAVSAALALGATACSSGSTDGTDGTESVKPTPTSATGATVYNECVDGAVQLWDETGGDAPIAAKDCAAANLISSDRTYQLDAIKTITIEASGTTVDVNGAERIVITGNGNTVRWTGERPEIDDQGEDNTDEGA